MADTPAKLPSTDFAIREHFDAEHNVANAIISLYTRQNTTIIYLFSNFGYVFFSDLGLNF